jgi:hypothetical protein
MKLTAPPFWKFFGFVFVFLSATAKVAPFFLPF